MTPIMMAPLRSRGSTRAVGAGLVALCVAALTGCGSSSASALTSAQRFTTAVDTAGRGGEPVAMTAITHFDWDHGLFACPADRVSDIEASLRGPWPDAPATADDGAAYVLFAQAGSVVDRIRLDRTAIDPCFGDPPLSARTFGPASELTVGAAASGTGWTLARAG